MNTIKTIMTIAAMCMATASHAQNVEKADSNRLATVDDTAIGMDYLEPARHTALDSLVLPNVNTFGRVESLGYCPYSWRWAPSWDLHEGLNVNLGLSVFAQFGKHSYSGVGFTQDVSALYAVPLTDRLSVAVGGYLSNINWAHDSYRDAGLTAMVGYRFDEHWEAFLYGQKSVVNGLRMPYPLYDMQELGDRIGASVRYNVNPSMSIEVSVERRSR
ncbi:MAG: hypothetical protein MSH36_09380 [Prevotella sp.]|nr:hypothetical protein [Prevotella sp.]MDD6754114.1 hypothetical protein [Prevotella sp.]